MKNTSSYTVLILSSWWLSPIPLENMSESVSKRSPDAGWGHPVMVMFVGL